MTIAPNSSAFAVRVPAGPRRLCGTALFLGLSALGCEPGPPEPEELGTIIQQVPELPGMEEPYPLPLPRPDAPADGAASPASDPPAGAAPDASGP